MLILKIALCRWVAVSSWTPIWAKRKALMFMMRHTHFIVNGLLKKAATSYRFKA